MPCAKIDGIAVSNFWNYSKKSFGLLFCENGVYGYWWNPKKRKIMTELCSIKSDNKMHKLRHDTSHANSKDNMLVSTIFANSSSIYKLYSIYTYKMYRHG